MPERGPRDGIVNGTGWHASPDALEFDDRLDMYDRAVWHNFAAHQNRKTGACFPSRDLQAKEIKCSRDKVSDARKHLLELGWLAKEKLIDEKTGRIIRYQWSIENPSASLPADGFTGRPVHRQTVKAAANQRKSKPNEDEPKEVEPITPPAAARVEVRPIVSHETSVVVERPDADIIAVFDVFRDTISPAINYGNKTQREAARILCKKFGVEKVVGAARYAVANFGKEMVPAISNPHELREKFARLIRHAQTDTKVVRKKFVEPA